MQSRRSFLTRIAASAGVLGVGSTAGCLGVLPVGGGDDGGAAPGYASRLYDPGQVVSAPNRVFVSHDLATLYERRDLYPDAITQQIERADESTAAVSVADLQRVTGFGYWQDTQGGPNASTVPGGGSMFVRGSFEPDAVLERLQSSTGTSYEAAGTVQGHDLYTAATGEGSAAVALSEDSVYLGGAARVDATGGDAARAMLTSDDAGYYSRSDTAKRLMDAMGEGATTVVGAEFEAGDYAPDSFEGTPAGEDIEAVVGGLRGLGSAMTFGEQTVARDVVGIYAEGETPTTENVDSLLALARQGIAAQAGPNADVEALQSLIDDTEVTVEDRTLTLSLSRETSALFDGGGNPVVGGVPGGPEAAVLVAPEIAIVGTYVLGLGQQRSTEPTPAAVFDFEYDGDTGELRITHTGGDTFSRDNTQSLAVQADGGVLTTWPLPVSAGDRVSVTVDGGQTVRVVWTAPGGSKTQTVSSFQTPS